ncbi:MAG: hypothetical protein ACKN9M_08550 [Burkholderiaceae bacterium]
MKVLKNWAATRILIALFSFAATPIASANTAEELQQQLQAQKAINQQLRQRVEELEALLVRDKIADPAQRDPRLLAPPALDAPKEEDTPETTSAIREALVSRGLLVLPPRSYRLIPGLAWVFSGSNSSNTRSDSYVGSLSLQAGLSEGVMLTATIPYLYRDTSIGTNAAMGDWAVGLTKQVFDETESLPSLLLSLSYQGNNDRQAFDPVAIGSIYPSTTARLLTLKRMDPLTLYGDVSYTHGFDTSINGKNFFGNPTFSGKLIPGDAYTFGFGSSLLVTPNATFDIAVNYSLFQGPIVDSVTTTQYFPSTRVGYLNAGAGFILSRHQSLLMSVGRGLTDESSDYFLSIALPYRF